MLEDGQVADAADQGEADPSGDEEPAVGEHADGEDALVVAADGLGVEELADDDSDLGHGACFTVGVIRVGEMAVAEMGGMDAPEEREAHADGFDGAEEHEPSDDGPGEESLPDGSGWSVHDARVGWLCAEGKGGEDVGAEVDAEDLEGAERHEREADAAARRIGASSAMLWLKM